MKVRTCALDEVLCKNTRLDGQSYARSEATSHAALRDELLELLITGHETTASSIAGRSNISPTNPESQTRLRDDLVSSLFPTNRFVRPSAKDITAESIPYLDALIAETLRLSDTGPVSFRQTLVPCEILGHQIPAGTPIILVTADPSYNSINMPPIPRVLHDKMVPQVPLQSSHQPPVSLRRSSNL
jgi:cytochrome P450